MRCGLGSAGIICPLWRSRKPRPNKRLHLTPLRVHKIGSILKAGFCSTVFPIYSAAQLNGTSLGRPLPESDPAGDDSSVAVAANTPAQTIEAVERCASASSVRREVISLGGKRDAFECQWHKMWFGQCELNQSR